MRYLVSAVLVAILAGPVAADQLARSWQQEIDLEGADRIELEIPVAEVKVEGEAGRHRVQLFVEAECDDLGGRCEKSAKQLTWKVRRSGDRLAIELDRWPDNGRTAPELEIRALVPEGADLRLELGVGEVEIHGIKADVAVEAGVGEVTVRSARSTVGSVSLDSGVGETRLRPQQSNVEESGFIGQELRWSDGPGEHSIRVDVGVGEIEVVLEP